MRILFAAGDVGGARAILPVAHLAKASGDEVMGLAHGVFYDEGEVAWRWLAPKAAIAQAAAVDVVVYATSVITDRLAVEVATRARQAGRPVLHVLDNWSNYATRLAGLIPDAYAVMDELALQEAANAGVPQSILVVTGHPDLAKLAQESSEFAGAEVCGRRLLFVSEPAALDGGRGRRGYDETEVAEALIKGIAAACPAGADLQVAPHPREDRNAVARRFAALSARITGAPQVSIVPHSDIRQALHTATHVAGMSSILLYEAWLLGRSVLALQPGLQGRDLWTLARRDGIIFHHHKTGTNLAVGKWLSDTLGAPRDELGRHYKSAGSVLSLARALVSKRAGVTNPLSPGAVRP